jgi:hypothetical protein
VLQHKTYKLLSSCLSVQYALNRVCSYRVQEYSFIIVPQEAQLDTQHNAGRKCWTQLLWCKLYLQVA